MIKNDTQNYLRLSTTTGEEGPKEGWEYSNKKV